MAVFQGDCECCKRRNVDVFEDTGLCLSCSRLQNLEEKVEALIIVTKMNSEKAIEDKNDV